MKIRITLLSYSPNIPWTPNIFTDSGPPIKGLLGGLIRGAPNPPNPPYGGSKIYFEGLLLMDHCDHHRVKYFCEAVGFKYHLSYPLGVPRPPNHLPPKIDLSNTIVDLSNIMVDLPNTMVDLPDTMVDIPN